MVSHTTKETRIYGASAQTPCSVLQPGQYRPLGLPALLRRRFQSMHIRIECAPLTLEQIKGLLNQLLDHLDDIQTMREMETAGATAIEAHARSILGLYQGAASDSDQVSVFRLLAFDSLFRKRINPAVASAT